MPLKNGKNFDNAHTENALPDRPSRKEFQTGYEKFFAKRGMSPSYGRYVSRRGALLERAKRLRSNAK
jgi:hypothetical protein